MVARGLLLRPDRMERVAIRGIEDMQAAVGGYVEPLTLPKFVAYFDEDGRMKNLPYNTVASLICGRDILGNVLILGPVDAEGNDTDLSDEDVTEIEVMIRQIGR